MKMESHSQRQHCHLTKVLLELWGEMVIFQKCKNASNVKFLSNSPQHPEWKMSSNSQHQHHCDAEKTLMNVGFLTRNCIFVKMHKNCKCQFLGQFAPKPRMRGVIKSATITLPCHIKDIKKFCISSEKQWFFKNVKKLKMPNSRPICPKTQMS